MELMLQEVRIKQYSFGPLLKSATVQDIYSVYIDTMNYQIGTLFLLIHLYCCLLHKQFVKYLKRLKL